MDLEPRNLCSANNLNNAKFLKERTLLFCNILKFSDDQWYSIFLASFEYHACLSRYLKAKHCVSDGLLARFAHTVGDVMASIAYQGRAQRYCNELTIAFLKVRRFLKCITR